MSVGAVGGHTVVAIGLALVVVLVGFVGRASALLTNVEGVRQASPPSSARKAVTAKCPSGKRLLGAGATTSPRNGRVLIDAIRPSNDLSSATAHAIEDEGGT